MGFCGLGCSNLTVFFFRDKFNLFYLRYSCFLGLGVMFVLYPVHCIIMKLLLNPVLPGSILGTVAFIHVDKETFLMHSR